MGDYINLETDYFYHSHKDRHIASTSVQPVAYPVWLKGASDDADKEDNRKVASDAPEHKHINGSLKGQHENTSLNHKDRHIASTSVQPVAYPVWLKGASDDADKEDNRKVASDAPEHNNRDGWVKGQHENTSLKNKKIETETSKQPKAKNGKCKTPCERCKAKTPKGICNLGKDEQLDMLLRNGVESVRLGITDTNFSVYLKTNGEKTFNELKMELGNDFPEHDFIFLSAGKKPIVSVCAGKEIKINPGTGTLGGFLRFQEEYYGLTCCHVLKEWTDGIVEMKDESTKEWKDIGFTDEDKEKAYIYYDYDEAKNIYVLNYDLAVFKVTNQNRIKKPGNENKNDCCCELTPIPTTKISEVEKTGSATGRRVGEVEEMVYHQIVKYPLKGGKENIDVALWDMIRIKNDNNCFADKGDSGSIVFYKDQKKYFAIGMIHCIGEDDKGQYAYAFKLHNALSELQTKQTGALRDATFGSNGDVVFTCLGHICGQNIA
ncbi:unnamed protein product [Owenia fusiformis]|uniref:Uncharacterized protein n=1 Tax=Owenia fusiformis TaxID=6347 RepID=A0A8S4PUD6_OWEFU|nr:unnamed protein product [Owenia fusiformis]